MVESRVINELQQEYYNLIEESFPELVRIFESGEKSVCDTVDRFLSEKATFTIPGYKDNLSYRRRQMFLKDKFFWNKYKDVFVEFIKAKQNIGIFGVGDNTYASEYLNEIKRNSMFFDILVFNDPFFLYYTTEAELDFDSNKRLFYQNLLYVWETKRYASLGNNDVFVIIFPFDCMMTDEDKDSIVSDCKPSVDLWIKEMFGITTEIRGSEDLAKNLSILKGMSLETVQTKLYENGINESIAEAMNYSQNQLTVADKQRIEALCFSLWGNFNRDFVKCILLMEALPGIAHVNYYNYKLHTAISTQLRSSSIIAQREWAPLRRDLKKHPLQVSTDYMYMCAVHRNNKMSELMTLSHDEIIKYHNKTSCAEFRNFFYRATEEIANTHSNFDEIATEVFDKTDALLKKEYADISTSKKKTNTQAVIGMAKGAIGFVPVISMLVAANDIIQSSVNLADSLQREPTIIEHIYSRSILEE